ncbi:ABC transporter ATP-binding protein [bacterium]|nr:ABC transporter ATP-binding protein [bacterium]
MLIDLRGVGKTYRLGGIEVRALQGVDLAIERGEHVSIMGPSGSGKSTMMNLIGCLDTPSAGQYFLEGIDVGTLSDDRLAEVRGKKIGFVFQTFNLLPRLDALGNVMLPLAYQGVPSRDRKARALDALSKVELSQRATHRPSELSGGERQRVAIARALVVQPSLLLADEPTGNLDSKVGKEILDLFDSLNREGVTIVVVTHDESVARRAKRLVRMRDGTKIADERLVAAVPA